MIKKGALVLISALIIFSLSVSSVSALYEANKTQAFLWLENKTSDKNWPRVGLTTEQFVFSYLALDAAGRINDTKQAAVFNLTKKGSGGCWPAGNCTVRETALAKLMLDSAGNSTELADEWLLNKTISYPVDWYLQIILADSDAQQMECVLAYDKNSYKINVSKEGKISGSAGNCYSTEQQYWLKLKQDCVDELVNVSCNKNFKVSYIFKKGNVWYVSAVSYTEEGIERISGEAKPANAADVLSIKPIKTYCLSLGASCDYEATAWAAYSFAKAVPAQKDNVRGLIPYLVMEKENQSNAGFLPEAFLYALTSSSEELGELKELQSSTNFLWNASGSPYNEFYDTSLVGIMTSQQAGNWSKAEKEIFKRQKTAGYWLAADSAKANQIRDTAMILYALQAIPGEISECETKGYDCVDNCTILNGTIQTSTCPEGKECCQITYANECEEKYYGSCKASCAENEIAVGYACPAGTNKCCKSYSSSTCVGEMKGKKCSSGQKCVKDGFVIPFVAAGDGDCCLGACVTPTQNCSQLNGTICKTTGGKSCADGKWLPSTDDQCCKTDACKLGVLTCGEIGGEVCEQGQICKGGNFVIAKDTADKCCIEGGRCVFEHCAGQTCVTGTECNGTEVEAEDAARCCINGSCLKSCASAGGSPCVSTNTTKKVCKEPITGTSNPNCCKPGKCSSKKAFPWLLLIFILLALLLVIVLFMKKRKKKGKPKMVMPGMMPPGRMARPGIFRRGQAPPAGRAPARPMPQLKPMFPIKQQIRPAAKPLTPAAAKPKPAEKKKAVMEELEKISKE
jgi:hypothetical protein